MALLTGPAAIATDDPSQRHGNRTPTNPAGKLPNNHGNDPIRTLFEFQWAIVYIAGLFLELNHRPKLLNICRYPSAVRLHDQRYTLF